jgi:signal transduction histidine kinase
MNENPSPDRSLLADVALISSIDAVPTILEVCCRTTGMGFAAIARVTEDRWIACAVRDEISFGLKPGGELKVETTICDSIRASGNAVVIDHVAEDNDFRGHPAPALYGFQSYLSMPIFRRDGTFFGTLCAIDPKPAKLKNPQVVGMFKLFAELISFNVDAEERRASSEAALFSERQSSELREQFIAVLGHDLRNPLASIDAGAALLAREKLEGKARTILPLMQKSVRRMANLIDNVLDLARGRLAGGLALKRNRDEPLEPALAQVVEELRAAWPERPIEADMQLDSPVDCDPARIAQLLSNLLANALVHGNGPVRVTARSEGGALELAVANGGAPIPPEVMARIFQPFYRAVADGNRQGLGIGLYIASEIARAHGGTLSVTSDDAETRFTLQVPAQAEPAI